ncbi:hypothetical protein Droror1_Dr00019814 [Drosera rotundifolia]
MKKVLVITWNDVVDERRYWQNALIGYVVGDRVPFAVMKGYVEQQGRKIVRSEVLLHEAGYFIFRFADMSGLLQIKEANWLFSLRPLVLNPWVPNFKFDDDVLEIVRTWVQFPGLDLQFWDKAALEKIGSRVRNLLYTDVQMTIKGRVSYPRVLLEVHMDKELVEQVQFIDPEGDRVQQCALYEWKPIRCSKCKI